MSTSEPPPKPLETTAMFDTALLFGTAAAVVTGRALHPFTEHEVEILSKLHIRPEDVLSGHHRIKAIIEVSPTEEIALKLLGDALKQIAVWEPMVD